VELRARGLLAEPQVKIPVYFKGEAVGEYYADILVAGKLIIETKCAERITDEHLAQGLNYLAATGLHMLIIINFQHPKVVWKRIVHNY
jgi:GxxExxY protein